MGSSVCDENEYVKRGAFQQPANYRLSLLSPFRSEALHLGLAQARQGGETTGDASKTPPAGKWIGRFRKKSAVDDVLYTIWCLLGE